MKTAKGVTQDVDLTADDLKELAGQFKAKGRRPLLVAADVYRPAAIQQLIINGEKVGVPVFSMPWSTSWCTDWVPSAGGT